MQDLKMATDKDAHFTVLLTNFYGPSNTFATARCSFEDFCGQTVH